MRKATKTVAMTFGILAGLAGLEHGIFEIQQGNIPPSGLMFASMGLPCDPAVAWNACEPALTILPNLLVAGILTVLLGVAIIVCSAGFIERRNAGFVLILLSIALLLAGGGVFPPLIGVIGGIAASAINKPLTGKPGTLTRFAARLWPWPLVIWVIWLLGQFPVGYFFNDFLKSIMGFGLLLILALLPLSLYTGYARDLCEAQ